MSPFVYKSLWCAIVCDCSCNINPNVTTFQSNCADGLHFCAFDCIRVLEGLYVIPFLFLCVIEFAIIMPHIT